ncbi:hypothetical protein ACQKWADRAFT_289205 [Trichoderma austrokoningii]
MPDRYDAAYIARFDDDEWRGTTDPKVRRRVQNRLNQRAYRLRRQTLGVPNKRSKKTTNSKIIPIDDLSTGYLVEEQSCERSNLSHAPLQLCHQDVDDKHGADTDAHADTAPWYTNPKAVSLQFYALKLGRHIGRSPSNDHLLCIMQFNVMRALGTISTIIGLSTAHLTDDACESPFFDPKGIRSCLSADNTPLGRLPKSLTPIDLQRSVPHHPWIDILPFPEMRRNLLRLELDTDAMASTVSYDADSLCHWMVGLDAAQKQGGLVVWGDPCDVASWEVTAEFYQHWGWTLKGCVELFRSTNAWRVRRGEKPFFTTELP